MDQISWSRIPGRTNTGTCHFPFDSVSGGKAGEQRIDASESADDMGAQQGAQLNDMCYKVFLLTLGHHFAIKFDPSSAEKVRRTFLSGRSTY